MFEKNRLKTQEKSSIEGKSLVVSVIIPMRNEESYIEKCVKSLIDQNYPKDCYEVIVVDGMSDDGSTNIVQSLSNNYSNIFLLENPNFFTSFGLNIGIRKSKGEVIIILGAHSFVEADFIKKNVETFENIEADCVGGSIENLGETYNAKAIALAMAFPFGIGSTPFRCSGREGYVDTVAFGAYKREVFKKIGLFDEGLRRNQDDEFNYRLRKNGGKIFITPQIRSFYYNRTVLKRLWSQYFQYGFWKIRVLQKHSKMMMLRQFIPAVFILSVTISLLLSFYDRMFFYLFLLILGSHFVCDFFFSFRIANKHGWKYFFFLPIVFNILHWSYGLGFLIGLFRFFRRWFIKESSSPKVTTEVT